MRKVKVRKPRGLKKKGYRSYDLCPCCYSPNCDPMLTSPLFHNKVSKRLANGLCVGCGKKDCQCKSKKGISEPLYK